jgi:hypothetical protein
MNELLCKDYLSIRIDHENKNLELVTSGYFNSIDFRVATKQALHYTREFNLKNWIANGVDCFKPGLDDFCWLVQEFLPSHHKLINKVALVLTTEAIVELKLENVLTNYQNIGIFDDEKKAKHWIRQ